MRWRYRRLQISLRTLLIAFLLGTAMIGWFVQRHQRERAAEDKLRESGFRLSFAPWGGGDIGQYWAYCEERERKKADETFGEKLRWTLFRHVKLVKGLGSLPGAKKINDDALRPLRDLHHVEILDVRFQPITDQGLSHIAHLKSLTSLRLSGSRVSDDGLTHLSRLQDLEDLGLEFTRITDDGLAHLLPLRNLRSLH